MIMKHAQILSTVLSGAAIFAPAATAMHLDRTINDLTDKLVQPTVDVGSGCTDNTRVEWRNMSDDDKLSFVGALKCLTDSPPAGPGLTSNVTIPSRYDEFAWVHFNMMDIVHGSDVFLPWHRYFVHAMETTIRNECDYKGPWPWWDETKDTGDLAGSGFFTPEYFGSLPPMDPKYQGTCVTDGAFANRSVTIGPTEPMCLLRGEDSAAAKEINVEALNKCQTNVTTFPKHRNCVEGNIHANTHYAIGPIMAAINWSVNDPIFWMHHSFIDWEWARWQQVDKKTRAETISGCDGITVGDEKCTPLTLDSVLSSKGLFPEMTVRDVLDTENREMCYRYDSY